MSEAAAVVQNSSLTEAVRYENVVSCRYDAICQYYLLYYPPLNSGYTQQMAVFLNYPDDV
jgi:hypothetical protein